MKSSLYDVMVSCVNGELQNKMPEFHSEKSAVTVVLASGGYPGSYKKGIAINVLGESKVRVLLMTLCGGTNHPKRDDI